MNHAPLPTPSQTPEPTAPAGNDHATQATQVIAFGEALLDQFADGAVCGGAPYNLARALHGLGVRCRFLTKIGRDAAGDALLADAQQRQLNTATVQRDGKHHTGIVTVSLDANGSPSYQIQTPAAWDFIDPPLSTQTGWQHAELFCYGTLALRHAHSRATLFDLLRQHEGVCFLDLNLRPTGPDLNVVQQALSCCDWLKLNDEELQVLRQALRLPEGDLAALQALAQRFEITQIALTRGALGASVYLRAASVLLHSQPRLAVAVVDTVGAGDGFSAAWIAAQRSGFAPAQALDFACGYAEAVCTHQGPAAAGVNFFEPWRSMLHS